MVVFHIMRTFRGLFDAAFFDPRSGVNHGTFLHIAHEEGLIRNTSIHAGIRAPVTNKNYDLGNDKACGFSILKARDIDRFGMQGIIDKLKARISGSKVYISVDIDVWTIITCSLAQ